MSPRKTPAEQVAVAKKAAALKAANADKNKVTALINTPGLREEDEAPAAALSTRKHDREHVHASRAPPRVSIRLLDKAEVLAIVNVSFPTIWTWMRAGTFPRSRVCGGKSMWRSDEIDAWLAALPVRKLKGDDAQEVA
jgi:predicted DNA-binding transcriptional regulator AlpA